MQPTWCVPSHPEELQEMGERSRTIVAEHYDWDAIVRQVEAVYEHVCSGGVLRRKKTLQRSA